MPWGSESKGGLNGLMKGEKHTHIYIYIYIIMCILYIYMDIIYIYGENAMVSVLYGPISKIEVFLLRKRLTSCMNDFG